MEFVTKRNDETTIGFIDFEVGETRGHNNSKKKSTNFGKDFTGNKNYTGEK